ncbi:hypothetical protein NPA08_02105 [Mycoplasmopsis citelli]|uniref:hypothetical protein n=1 Tax=Mycoplasmopsis citelli TaxID=171281 RepID=UPI0021141EA0|nr:hypothetical protein [Mycoplasmopsis citelli]UUD36598.1 hypothetical protein NPA08_02105 [Mycoplasmopsis citelli]
MLKNKKILKNVLLASGVTSVFGGSILGTALGILRYKNSQLKDKEHTIVSLNSEIKLLKIQISDMQAENTELKNQISALEGVLKIVNAANDSQNGETNELLNKLINTTEESSLQISKNQEYQKYLQTHLNKLKNSLIVSVNVLLDKLKNLSELNSEKFQNAFLNTKITQLNELVKNINELDLSNTNNFSENSQFLNTYQKRYHDFNLELIENLNTLINQNKNSINELNSKISDTSKKLKESISKSIQTTINLNETITVLKKYTDLLLEKSLNLGSKSTSDNFKGNLEQLSKSLAEYQQFLQEQIKLTHESLKKANENNDYSNLVILDTDVFASKVKYFTQLSSNYSNLAINIYLNFYEESLRSIAEKDEQIDKISKEKEQLNNQINEANRQKTKALASLKKLKESLTTSFKNSLNSIITSLRNIDLAIQSSDATQKQHLSQRLNEQIINLEALRNEYSSDEFINRYEPFVESALKTADQVIQEYKDNILNKLKEEYKITKRQLDESNKALIEAKNLLNSKSDEINVVNAQLKKAKADLANKESEFIQITKQLEQTRDSLAQLKVEKNSSLSEMSATIDRYVLKYNQLKNTANTIIDEAIKQKLNVDNLRLLISKSFAPKDPQNFIQMNNLSKEYLAHYLNLFEEMIRLHKKVLEKRVHDQNLVITGQEDDISSYKLTINQNKAWIDKLTLDQLQLQSKIDQQKEQLAQSDQTIKELQEKINKSGLNANKTVTNTNLNQDYLREFHFQKREAISSNQFHNSFVDTDSYTQRFKIKPSQRIQVYYFNKNTKKMENFILTSQNSVKKLYNKLQDLKVKFNSVSSNLIDLVTTGYYYENTTSTYEGDNDDSGSFFEVSYEDGYINVLTKASIKTKAGKYLYASAGTSLGGSSESPYSYDGGTAKSSLFFVSAIALDD